MATTSPEGDNTVRRTFTFGSNPGQTDPLDLPLREVNPDANLEEFTTETRTGNIIKPIKSNITGQIEDWKLVTFKIDDPENPRNWSKLYKWWCTMVVAWTCFVVAFSSSVITADLEGVSATFGVSEEVSLLTITVFVIGFGVGMCYPPVFTSSILTDVLSRTYGICTVI